MRRKDREVTDIAKIKEIMRNCNACRVGFADGDKVYIVPLSFGFTETVMELRYTAPNSVVGIHLLDIMRWESSRFRASLPISRTRSSI